MSFVPPRGNGLTEDSKNNRDPRVLQDARPTVDNKAQNVQQKQARHTRRDQAQHTRRDQAPRIRGKSRDGRNRRDGNLEVKCNHSREETIERADAYQELKYINNLIFKDFRNRSIGEQQKANDLALNKLQFRKKIIEIRKKYRPDEIRYPKSFKGRRGNFSMEKHRQRLAHWEAVGSADLDLLRPNSQGLTVDVIDDVSDGNLTDYSPASSVAGSQCSSPRNGMSAEKQTEYEEKIDEFAKKVDELTEENNNLAGALGEQVAENAELKQQIQYLMEKLEKLTIEAPPQ